MTQSASSALNFHSQCSWIKTTPMNIQPIAFVQSAFIDKFGTPRQSQIAKSTVSQIAFDKQKAPAAMLIGLKVGDPIWVLFGFHLNDQKKAIIKVHPPRLKGKKIGVLASRSPHRPNPIGLSLGFITAIDGSRLSVSGLDIVNGSPVFDIKPYLPEFDRPKKAKTADWIKDNPFQKLKVRFARGLTYPTKNVSHFKKCIREILAEDPRPRAYYSRPHHQYWLKYQDWDIGFTISDPHLIINTIIPLKR